MKTLICNPLFVSILFFGSLAWGQMDYFYVPEVDGIEHACRSISEAKCSAKILSKNREIIQIEMSACQNLYESNKCLDLKKSLRPEDFQKKIKKCDEKEICQGLTDESAKTLLLKCSSQIEKFFSETLEDLKKKLSSVLQKFESDEACSRSMEAKKTLLSKFEESVKGFSCLSLTADLGKTLEQRSCRSLSDFLTQRYSEKQRELAVEFKGFQQKFPQAKLDQYPDRLRCISSWIEKNDLKDKEQFEATLRALRDPETYRKAMASIQGFFQKLQIKPGCYNRDTYYELMCYGMVAVGTGVVTGGASNFLVAKYLPNILKIAGFSDNPESTFKFLRAESSKTEANPATPPRNPAEVTQRTPAVAPNSTKPMQSHSPRSRKKMDELLSKYQMSPEDLEKEKLAILAGKPPEKTLLLKNAKLNDQDRFKKIREDFENLEAWQVNCIVQMAHPIGREKGKGILTYDKIDLQRKAKTLNKNCKISDTADITALIRLGYAGDPPKEMDDSLIGQILRMKEPVAKDPRTSASSMAVQSDDRYKMPANFQDLDSKTKKATLENLMVEASEDPLRRAFLRRELKDVDRELEREKVAAYTKDNPNLLDDSIRATQALSRKPSVPQRVGIPLSEERRKTLSNSGLRSFEIEDFRFAEGDSVFINSFGFGARRARIVGPSEKFPGEIRVEFTEISGSHRGEKRVVSVKQSDIAVSQDEIQTALKIINEEERKLGRNALEKSIELTQSGSGEQDARRWAESVARSVARSPQKVEFDELTDELANLKAAHRGDPKEFSYNTRVNEIGNRLVELTGFTRGEDLILEAMNEVNVDSLKPSKATLEAIENAKKLRARKIVPQFSPEDQQLLNKVDEVEKLLKSAPDRALSKLHSQLYALNKKSSLGSYDMPKLEDSMKAFNISNQTREIEGEIGKIHHIFTTPLEYLEEDQKFWLRRYGESYLKKAQTGTPSTQKKFYSDRLRIYIEYLNVEFIKSRRP